MGFNVTVDVNTTEEMQDFLLSNAWEIILDFIAADCILSRKALLTALTISETQRISHVTKLQAYMNLVLKIHQAAGKKELPRKYLELFTGAES